jgi:putative transposase
MLSVEVNRMQQQSFELRTWGGKRKGAGRKPEGERARPPRMAREPFGACQPVHVTLRCADHVWNLRSQRSFRIIDGAVRGIRGRRDFRVVHFSVLGNHLHLVVEAAGPGALANGMRALGIRLARRLNAMMGRRGRVFEGRYHAHVLRTPTEVRNAVRYVLGNFARHARRRGERVPQGWVDPFSSEAGRAPRDEQCALFVEPATRPAETWLLRTAVEVAAKVTAGI